MWYVNRKRNPLNPRLFFSECSRKYHEVLKFFDKTDLHPNEHFRCTSNGDYDTIQCIGDACMCTDAQDGAPTFPNEAPVNISLISSTTLPNCCKTFLNKCRPSIHVMLQSRKTSTKPTNTTTLAPKNIWAFWKSLRATKATVTTLFSKWRSTQSATWRDNMHRCRRTRRRKCDWFFWLFLSDVFRDPVSYYCSFPNGTQIGEYQGSDETDMDCSTLK